MFFPNFHLRACSAAFLGLSMSLAASALQAQDLDSLQGVSPERRAAIEAAIAARDSAREEREAASEAARQESNAVMLAISSGSPDAARFYGDGSLELSYATLLPLYMAAHREQLHNAAFAWHHFLLYTAPEGAACTALRQSLMNPIRFNDFLNSELASLEVVLKQFDGAPREGVFTVPVDVVLAGYDQEKGVFPVRAIRLIKDKLLPESRCSTVLAPPGASNAPASFNLGVRTSAIAAEWRTSTEEASEFMDRNRLFFGSGRESLKSRAIVKVSGIPFTGSSLTDLLGIDIVEVTIPDPSTGRILFTLD